MSKADPTTEPKRFSSEVAKQLGIEDLKLLIAVKKGGEKVYLVSELATVVQIGPAQYQTMLNDPKLRPDDKVYDVTYDDKGKKGWCISGLLGGLSCH